MESGISLIFRGKLFEEAATGLAVVASTLTKTWEGEAVVVQGVLRDYLNTVVHTLDARHSGAWPGGTSAKTLSKRTGQGMASVVRSVKVSGTSWENLFGSVGGNGYMAIHEYGGTIHAKRKFLTIPLPAALTPRGTSAPFARQWKNTFVARSRAGNLIVFQRRGRDVVPLYLLRASVNIPARLGLRKELDNQIPYFLSRALDHIMRDITAQLGD